MRRGSAEGESDVIVAILPAADERDDLQSIVGRKDVLGMPPARHDLQIHLDGHRFAAQAELLQQYGDRAGVGHFVGLVVDKNLHYSLFPGVAGPPLRKRPTSSSVKSPRNVCPAFQAELDQGIA